jgi:hypothetical protein
MEVPAHSVGFRLLLRRRATRQVPSRIAVKRTTAYRCEVDLSPQALRRPLIGAEFAVVDTVRFNW